MYPPQYDGQARNDLPGTPHIHAQDTTLQAHENEESFKTYLRGRTALNEKLLQTLDNWAANIETFRKNNPGNDHLWAYTEGQLEAIKELRDQLTKDNA